MQTIYGIGWKGSDTLKIGRSAKLGTRVKQLQTGSPEPLRIEFVLEVVCSSTEEAKIHKALRLNRVRGEWFERPAAEVLLKRLGAVSAKVC